MAWIPDTNFWINYFKNPGGKVEKRLRQHAPEEVLTCAVVRAELLRGAQKYGQPERRREKVVQAPPRAYRCHSTMRPRMDTPQLPMTSKRVDS